MGCPSASARVYPRARSESWRAWSLRRPARRAGLTRGRRQRFRRRGATRRAPRASRRSRCGPGARSAHPERRRCRRRPSPVAANVGTACAGEGLKDRRNRRCGPRRSRDRSASADRGRDARATASKKSARSPASSEVLKVPLPRLSSSHARSRRRSGRRYLGATALTGQLLREAARIFAALSIPLFSAAAAHLLHRGSISG